ncbi:MAG: ABC transporter ATP-binding protein [Nitrososphaerota archaeon]
MLDIKKINSGYGKLHILFDIDAIVNRKDIVVIVGPNGSGKSTLLKTIFGLTNIYSGSIKFKEEELVGLPPYQIAKKGIAYLPQVDNVFSNLTVKENLIMAGYTLDKEEANKKAAEVSEVFPIIKKFYNKKAETLSGGEKQMLAMAMALMREPEIMMFDEPTASLAPNIAMQIFDHIVSLRDDLGITIVIAEQNAIRALEHGDKALLLVSGRVIFKGNSKDLLSHSELGKLYLGISS